VLYLAFELGWNSWKLAFTIGAGQKPRLRGVPARSLAGLALEIKKAKERFGLLQDTPVISCYEAGRDGFWLHRFLLHEGVRNIVVDSASIEVNRRKRRAKSDHARQIAGKQMGHGLTPQIVHACPAEYRGHNTYLLNR
jgi:transposase